LVNYLAYDNSILLVRNGADIVIRLRSAATP
jgi:hypothetical protein